MSAHVPLPRGMLSIRALHLETGLHPKRMRKLLAAAGILSVGHEVLSDAKVVFDAEKARAVITADIGALSRPQAGKYLNAPRVQMLLLAKSGLLHSVGDEDGLNEKFPVEELNQFLAKLLRAAKPVRRAPAGSATIPEAAKRACCSAIDIVQAILEGLLTWVGHLEDEKGYLSVLVAIEEVKALARGPEHGGISLRDVSVRLGTKDRVVQALVDARLLAGLEAINPVNHCPQTVVTPDEVERFRSTYISLNDLARAAGKGLPRVKQELKARGIQPAFRPKLIGATFYVLEEVRRE
ncbi:hypothetical protein ACVIGB_000975 [Bradyrhizobium sp. USDA 4341]